MLHIPMCFGCAVMTVLTLLSPANAQERVLEQRYADSIDAVSVKFTSSEGQADVRGFDGEAWGVWQTMTVDTDQDPALRESDLVMFPRAVELIELRTKGDMIAAIHPIRVSRAPASVDLAAVGGVTIPRIFSRAEWGADEALLFERAQAPKSESAPAELNENGSGQASEVSTREKDCVQAQEKYPEEFQNERTVTSASDGKKYRWPLQYSKDVRLLVVHHTAMEVTGDTRSGIERVRALYQYHADSRGWGDLGYNYLIDEKGQIYEGRQGGGKVIAAHAYCHNTGSLGIALLGNFEMERPTQKQIASLQWLLKDLADRYEIPLDRKVRFHGKTLPTVVAHRDLLSTTCPGYFFYGVLDQVRTHVRNGELTTAVTFPSLFVSYEDRTEERTKQRVERIAGGRSTGPIDRRLAAKLKSTAVGKLRRTLRNRVEAAGGTPRPGSKLLERSTTTTIRSRSPSRPDPSPSSPQIRIRLTKIEGTAKTCAAFDLDALQSAYRGSLSCSEIDGKPAVINQVGMEDYLAGLAEEGDTEPYEKQRAFAIAARSYAAYWAMPKHRKFEGMPYDGTDSPATFQSYGGIAFETRNSRWVKSVRETAGRVLLYNGEVVRAPYFSSDTGMTRSPVQAGWSNFPLATEVFFPKDDPWCAGFPLAGHGVGMSGCGAEGQANEGKTAEEILQYYYPGTSIGSMER